MILCLFYLWFLMLLILIFTLIIRYRPNERLKKWRDNSYQKVFWNGLLVLFLQGYLEFGMSSMMAFEKPLPSSFGKDRKGGETLSYFLAVATVPVIFIVVPVLAVWFAFQDFYVVKLMKFKKRFGMLYSGFKYRTFKERLSPYIFIVRRQMVILNIMTMHHLSSGIKIVFYMLGQLLVSIYIFGWQVRFNKSLGRIDIFNEIMIIVISFHMFLFSDWLLDPKL